MLSVDGAPHVNDPAGISMRTIPVAEWIVAFGRPVAGSFEAPGAGWPHDRKRSRRTVCAAARVVARVFSTSGSSHPRLLSFATSWRVGPTLPAGGVRV